MSVAPNIMSINLDIDIIARNLIAIVLNYALGR